MRPDGTAPYDHKPAARPPHRVAETTEASQKPREVLSGRRPAWALSKAPKFAISSITCVAPRGGIAQLSEQLLAADIASSIEPRGKL